ncbi:MAG: AAA family ATPase [Candidatus Methanomethylicia archaeon]|nr:AAA family ATPase [Candidatus Methanomethylicia archaeon]MCX8169335.1 AAA family ATPase [Candidatus Methanomethylicia archaeon]MDW7988882.1 AAA family ATPase [Nitrososphaerota archaeon]
MDSQKVIIIHGCPGTGKTLVSEKLSRLLKAIHINISEIALREELFIGFDKERESFILDEESLKNRIIDLIVKSESLVIVEGHHANIVPPNYVIKVFVLRRHPVELEKVLELRGWKKEKILENVLAEILDYCVVVALETYGSEKVVEVDVTNRNVDDVVMEILSELYVNKIKSNYHIDWIKVLKHEGLLEKYIMNFSSSQS